MKLLRSTDGWHVERAGKYVRLGSFDFDQWLASPDPIGMLSKMMGMTMGGRGEPPPALPPVGTQEVWAAGVTYERSKVARMEESESAASAYDKVYAAARPEIFFKATPSRCVGHGGKVLLRQDSKWMVPEPELVLVVSAFGKVVGFTIGDDLSCRDIEGENTLYLPQAKVWDRCCAIGPAILVNDGSVNIQQSTIALEIVRGGDTVFKGDTPLSRIRRSFHELVGYLFRHQTFANGVLLFTGTGIVPPDDFTLKPGDEIRMTIPEIGTLVNTTE